MAGLALPALAEAAQAAAAAVAAVISAIMAAIGIHQVGKAIEDEKEKAKQASDAAKTAPNVIPQTKAGATQQCPNLPPRGKQAKISPEEQQALDKIGPLEGKSRQEIGEQLKPDYGEPVEGDNGGDIYIKDLGNGRSVRVRVDPAKVRNPPEGKADDVPHAHKETVDTGTDKDKEETASKDAKNEIKFDDTGCPSTDWKDTHTPIKWTPGGGK